MKIDKYKIRVTSFTAELEKPLDPAQRTIIQTEVEIYETSHRDNNDETFDEIYRAKVVGATDCKQGGLLVKGKSKRSQSKKIRARCWMDDPSDAYYEWFTNNILAHYEEVKEFLKGINKI